MVVDVNQQCRKYTEKVVYDRSPYGFPSKTREKPVQRGKDGAGEGSGLMLKPRDFDLHGEVRDWIGEKPESALGPRQSTYAVSCSWRQRGVKRWLESWNHHLAVGRPLPTLPLWLSDELAILLELEAGCKQTCRALRIA